MGQLAGLRALLPGQRSGHTIALQEHYTDWLSGRASKFIVRKWDPSKPFCMKIAPFDTHEPLSATPRRGLSECACSSPPSFDEKDVSDKPRWVRNQLPLNAWCEL